METPRAKKTVHIQFLTAEGCHECENAKRLIQDTKKTFPYLTLLVEEIDISGLKGLELAVKHSVMENPGVIINGELFSTGRLDRGKFIDKILSL